MFILKIIGKHPLDINGVRVWPGGQIELEDYWLNDPVVKKLLAAGAAVIVPKSDEQDDQVSETSKSTSKAKSG